MARSRFILAFAGLLLSGLVLAGPSGSKAADARRPTPVSYMVICQDAVVREKFKSRIDALLKANSGYVLREQLPSAQLIVYVNRDANDGVNAKGYSIAIAHVSNVEAYFLANKFLIEKPTEDIQLKNVVTTMLNEHGMLEHLNVAHIDAASDREIDLMSREVVAGFFAKTPADAGR